MPRRSPPRKSPRRKKSATQKFAYNGEEVLPATIFETVTMLENKVDELALVINPEERGQLHLEIRTLINHLQGLFEGEIGRVRQD